MTGQILKAVVFESDAARRQALSFMFNAIGVPAEAYAACIHSDLAADIVILGETGGDQSADLRALTKKSDAFVLVIHNASNALSAEDAFLNGAGDVVKTPTSLREIALRLRARLPACHFDPALFFDPKIWSQAALIAHRLNLTESEAQILNVLVAHRNEIMSRDALSQILDGRPWEYGDRKFDVHVAKIRKKLEAEFADYMSVTTIRSAGYRLAVADEDLADLAGFAL